MYSDGGEGASVQCVEMTMESLKSALTCLHPAAGSPYVVETTNSKEIRSGEWMDSCCLLVMPGGRDSPYVRELAGQGNDNIRQFVAKGGSYLGLCAGAYYACSRVEFAVGDPAMEVVGPRELAFFPGIGWGPVFPGFDYKSNRGSRAAGITLQAAGERIVQSIFPTPITPDQFPLYYNGGCKFVCFKDKPNTQFEVLATYTHEHGEGSAGTMEAEELSAIVCCRYGKGKAILSGVHFEASASLLVKHYDDTYTKALLPQLKKYEAHREKLMASFVKYLVERNDNETKSFSCNVL